MAESVRESVLDILYGSVTLPHHQIWMEELIVRSPGWLESFLSIHLIRSKYVLSGGNMLMDRSDCKHRGTSNHSNSKVH